MKRIITGITAAGVAALMLLSTSARADRYRDEGRQESRDQGRRDEGRRVDREDGRFRGAEVRERRAGEWRELQRERRAGEWRELQRERQVFYARWDGNPWRRARFERRYARRCAELRNRW